MLGSKEAPFFLTILFSLLGFTVKHLSDRILADSFVEYHVKYIEEDNKLFYDCTITNVSTRSIYEDLSFKISIEDTIQGKIINAFVIPSPPLFISDTGPTDISSTHANFTIKKIIPGSVLTLRVNYKGYVKPDFLFDPESDDATSINLKESNFITWIARSEFEILFFLIVIWGVLIIIYMLWLRKQKVVTD